MGPARPRRLVRVRALLVFVFVAACDNGDVTYFDGGAVGASGNDGGGDAGGGGGAGATGGFGGQAGTAAPPDCPGTIFEGGSSDEGSKRAPRAQEHRSGNVFAVGSEGRRQLRRLIVQKTRTNSRGARFFRVHWVEALM
jgi:hypothetical protein